jgi:hypothetical protein
MKTNSDFEEILLAFNDAGVKYLVVGAYAVAAHSRPRATGDIDLWIEPAENARRVFHALAAFGAQMDHVEERTFCEPDIVFQIGIPPIRIDIMTAIDECRSRKLAATRRDKARERHDRGSRA